MFLDILAGVLRPSRHNTLKSQCLIALLDPKLFRNGNCKVTIEAITRGRGDSAGIMIKVKQDETQESLPDYLVLATN